MNMNNTEIFTKSIMLIVKLDEYDFDHPEKFDVVIKTGDVTKVFTFSKFEINRQGAKKTGYCRLSFSTDELFSLDKLEITCKYPIIVRCDDFIISNYIFPAIAN